MSFDGKRDNGQSAGFVHRFERVLKCFGWSMCKRRFKCVRKEKYCTWCIVCLNMTLCLSCSKLVEVTLAFLFAWNCSSSSVLFDILDFSTLSVGISFAEVISRFVPSLKNSVVCKKTNFKKNKTLCKNAILWRSGTLYVESRRSVCVIAIED